MNEPMTPAPHSSPFARSRRTILLGLAAALPALTVVRAAAQRPDVPPGSGTPPPSGQPGVPPSRFELLPTPVKSATLPAAVAPARRGIISDSSTMAIGDDSDGAALTVTQGGTGSAILVQKPDEPNYAVRIDAYGHGMVVQQTHDFAGGDNDLINLYHRSTGDAIYTVHLGGRPPGYSGLSGTNACINMLIPYYLDDTTARRMGAILNDRTGMRGLHVESQPTNPDIISVNVVHWGGGPAVQIVNQYATKPQGHGSALTVVHYGNAAGINIGHYGAGAEPTIKVLAYDVPNRTVLDIRDGSNTYPRLAATGRGMLHFGTGYVPEDTTLQRTALGTLSITGSDGNGALAFGAAGDARLYRSGADILRTDNRFQIQRGDNAEPALEVGLHSSARRLRLMPLGQIDFGDGAIYDVKLYRNVPGQLTVDGRLSINRPSTGDLALLVSIPGSVQYRLIVTASGSLWWSSGAANVDTNLYRAGADHLRTDDLLSAQSVAVTGDAPGQANAITFTNAHSTGVPRGPGTGTIKFADGASRDSAGFLKVKIGTTDYFVPVFAAAEPMQAAAAASRSASTLPPPDVTPPPEPRSR